MRVALTIDAEHPDRPHRPGAEAELLDALDEAGARSTWFVQGRWAEAHPAIASRIARDGHLIGNHSHHHARLSLMTAAGISEDTRLAEAAIREATGVDPRPWYRWPFGDAAGEPSVGSALAELGYRGVGWHVEAEDWEPSATPDGVTRSILEGARRVGDGAVLLLHSWPTATREALPAILERLAKEGTTLVTLDALAEDRLPTGPA